MRSQGQVRFIKVSTRAQALAATGVVVLLAGWMGAMVNVTLAQVAASRERSALLLREAKVASAQRRVEAYRKDIDSVASDLARRQDFIQRLVEAHLGDLPADPDAAQTDAEAEKTARKISAALPAATALARVEADQFAFVQRLTHYADRRATRAADAIRRLGINPDAMLAGSRMAEGGPRLRLATSRNGALDPRFRRMGLSLARMDALASGLASLPQVQPAQVAYVSSSFGYRADPFDGEAAFHAGLDFPGPLGSPIYAAANGMVTFVGQKQGYGNCVEITHGNGLMTRYGHLSGFGAHVGQKVSAGTRIAAMGSTGRSTGPHLHFEVRINDRPVNPRPFLEAASRAQAALAQQGAKPDA